MSILSLLMMVGTNLLFSLPIILMFIYVLNIKAKTRLIKLIRIGVVIQFTAVMINILVQAVNVYFVMNPNNMPFEDGFVNRYLLMELLNSIFVAPLVIAGALMYLVGLIKTRNEVASND